MAFNKRLSTLKTPAGPKIIKVVVKGSFLANGASNPVAASNRGDAFSVVRTSAGLYTVTLGGATAATGQYSVKQFLDLQVTLQKGAAGVAVMAVPGLMVESAGTFQVRIETPGTGAATELAAGTDNRVHFSVTFSNGAS